jgi:RNA polymerase sigma-70 factor (ECF subfamily)
VSQAERLPEEGPGDADERELVRASAAGDQDAFAQLVERYRRLVLHVAFRSMGDMSLAEDVSQEAFIKVYRGLPKYRHEKPFVHWLRRVVGNAVMDELRRRRPVVSLDGMEQPPAGDEEDPQEVTDQHGVQQAVRAAIAALPPRYRDIISLQVFQELTYEEIARTLNLPLGTVMWRLNMAKRLLRRQLRDTAEAESA